MLKNLGKRSLLRLHKVVEERELKAIFNAWQRMILSSNNRIFSTRRPTPLNKSARTKKKAPLLFACTKKHARTLL